MGDTTPPTTGQLHDLSEGEYALQPVREDTHYRCALVGALHHQANKPVTIAYWLSPYNIGPQTTAW